jgi:DNA invertase Pin-like site-specific DNA recombinase
MQRKIKQKEIQKIKEMLANKEHLTTIAKTLKVSRMTLFRHIRKMRLNEKRGFFSKLFRRK